MSQGILEIQRGKGTFISQDVDIYDKDFNLKSLERVKMRLRDLFDLRMIFEPEITYRACVRASQTEIDEIIALGLFEEKLIREGKERTDADQKFHQAIVKASHNDYMTKLFPMINNAIDIAIQTYPHSDLLSEITVRDHALIMSFLKDRDAQGAKCAMMLHINHAVSQLGIKE
jgi:DNA-binding FadR family transcriptional regulator